MTHFNPLMAGGVLIGAILGVILLARKPGVNRLLLGCAALLFLFSLGAVIIRLGGAWNLQTAVLPVVLVISSISLLIAALRTDRRVH